MMVSDNADAKKILTASPLEDWTRPPGCPLIIWMKTAPGLPSPTSLD